MIFPLLYFFDTGGWFAALLPAVVAHELGHWAAVRACGGRIRALRLDLAGLCMEITPLSSRGAELLAAAAGPAAGLIWIFWAVRFGAWGRKCALAAALINGFNLLPALPLDGGRFLLALTGSPSFLRGLSLATAVLLIAAAAVYSQWRLLIPAGVILRRVIRPKAF